MKLRTLCLLASLAVPQLIRADAGILIPLDKTQPDPSVLSMAEMEVDIRISNGDARVWVRQIFLNHTSKIEEGNYIFAVPSRTTISDFAVWDGPTRIPAVILERKRAQEIYNELKMQEIDPGLLQQGERSDEDVRHSSAFSAHIVPIPANGTKRLEIEYHQNLPVENLKSYFVLPLHPDAYQAQTVGHLKIHLELHSSQEVKDFSIQGKTFPLQVQQKDAHTIEGNFEGSNVSLAEDLAATWNLDAASTNRLDVLTYRNPKGDPPAPDEPTPARPKEEPGFFEASVLVGKPASAPSANQARNIIILFDNSLSMQWDKLERSYTAMAKLLNALQPADHFNLLLFNTKIETFSPMPVAADRAAVTKALDFVRASHLRGGTDLQAALDAGLKQCTLPASTIVLLTDGGVDRGLVQGGKLASWYTSRWNALPAEKRPRTDIFAVGDDANLQFLRLLSRDRGLLESVLSTEPIDFKLESFLSKIGRSPVGQIRFDASPSETVRMVYPLDDATFTGSVTSWVGQYATPKKSAALSVQGVADGAPFHADAKVSFPEESLEHVELPRLWAKARVDALLEQIEREGESKAAIEEIIRLSRKYKFVTPYTSFLAVPRALLRPRVIRPGDPVLRVRTDSAIVSVIALFPFGLTKPLRYLPEEDIWQTRFLAPSDMKDGSYSVRLIMRDKNGNSYREAKSFVIASTPPTVRVHLDSQRVRRGTTVKLRVSASESTRTLTARLQGLVPVSLHWNQSAGSNVGELAIPDDLPTGNYSLTVTAEDIAHNLGSQEVSLEVVP